MMMSPVADRVIVSPGVLGAVDGADGDPAVTG
jgi:hypothetical protein